MPRSFLALSASAILAVLAAGWGVVAHERHGPAHEVSPHSVEASAFVRAMDDAMARMMTGMHRPAAGDPDRDFLAMMIPHHQGAVDMARLVLLHGRDPLTRQVAEHVLATQVVEMEAMRRRLEALSSLPRASEYPALGGTRGDGVHGR